MARWDVVWGGVGSCLGVNRGVVGVGLGQGGKSKGEIVGRCVGRMSQNCRMQCSGEHSCGEP